MSGIKEGQSSERKNYKLLKFSDNNTKFTNPQNKNSLKHAHYR